MTRASGDGSLIAVVGMSCRLPRAPDLGAYWSLLRSGEEAVSATPPERWEMSGYGAGDGLADADRRVGFGGFLDRVDGFDPGFFGISPKQAEAMDPQQRLMLELSWEALEDARIVPSSIRGERAGVFLGAIAGDYESLSQRRGAETISRHTALGLHRSMIANRVSYSLGLTGPSLTIDTAQSSSLVAVHLACESLRRGEASLALAGGVHLNLDPRVALTASRFGGLSPDGKCFTFDARANGYVRGEGGGLIALKPLAAARADGDPIHCVIQGSAMNNDGPGAGLTVPSRAAQEKVLSNAYRRAGLKRSEVQYVELHGSGTPVGDPIEAAALGAVLGAERAGSDPLPVGSVKTNIGHLEGAAGIAGLIKAALAIERRELPPSLNFERPNPEIPLEALGLRVQGALGSWPDEDRPLVAGVSSFGIGGTNCHVVVTEEPGGVPAGKGTGEGGKPDASPSVPLPGQIPLVLSAKTPAALRAQGQRLAGHLGAIPGLDRLDVAYSLSAGRETFEHRAVVVGEDLEDLLVSLQEGEPRAGLTVGKATAGAGPVLLFPGYGSQWDGMALGLLDSSPVFAAQMGACIEALEPYLDWSVEDVLRGVEGAPPLDRPDVGQLALFAVMISLAELWRSLGVEPTAVVGHSLGEVVAAHFAGGLSLDDTARVAVLRNRALVKLVGHGAMASVALSAQQLDSRLECWEGRLGVAAINGPASAVISGDSDALDGFLLRCEQDGVRVRKVRGAVAASHSPQVEALREELLVGLAAVRPRSGEVAFHSTVTGEVLDTAELDAEYWYRNVRETVQLEPVLRARLEAGERTFIEVSPHPVLTVGLQETIEAVVAEPGAVSAIATLRRDEADPARFAQSAAEAHVAGVEIDWGTFFAGSGARPIPLPTYAFQRKRYWIGGSDGDRLALSTESIDYSADDDGLGDDDASAAADLVGGQMAAELAGLSQRQRELFVLEKVKAEAAVVLGHAAADEIEAETSFKDQGFDSPAGVELRNRLVTACGLRLSATAVFDHPSPIELAAHLLVEATGGGGAAVVGVAARASEEPIAILGMACRYPGGVGSPQELWRLVAEGRDGVSGFPEDRGWDLEGLYDPDPDSPGTSYARHGGFLRAPGDFDAEFFGIGPREALAMDPQQRLLLEASWQALESGGLDPSSLRGDAVGVFAGVAKGDYDTAIEGYRMTGGLASVVAGRISYSLGLEGPAISIDTACSSSLVAMHLAAQAVRAGECTLALAGGATVLATPETFVEFSRQRGLAPDGRCKSFSEAADGVGWAEGVGMLALERLSDAQANGHPVLAVIRGSAVNQDGASNGLTAPNGPSQERVIRQALANARLTPQDIDAVEAHGTGTTLGDPIEAGALLATYGQDRDTPLRLGSIKSNIGHTQAAAGVAGVIKTVMAMREGLLPKSLHIDQPSAKVDWSSGEIELLSEAVEWKEGERPRRAGVSSFGISGTNAHLILEEAPAQASPGGAGVPGEGSDASSKAPLPGPTPLLVSAKSKDALQAQAARLAAHLKDNPELDLEDLAFSLATTRSSFEQRAVALGSDRKELLEGLDALSRGADLPGLVKGRARSDARPVFLFSGQGAQHARMAAGLLEGSPAFAANIAECETALSPFVDWSLAEVLVQETGDWLDRLDVVQPALFAVMVSLAELWRESGVRPAAVVGHSQGEIAAAHIAGGLSLQDAARVVALRAKAMAKIAGAGGMLSVSLPAAEASRRIAPFAERVSLAAINGPASVVLSGEPDALGELRGSCEKDGVRTRPVAVDYAAHSAQIEALEEELLDAFAPISPRSGEIPFHSTVSGEALDTAELDAGYWYRNLRQTVRFEPALRSLLDRGHRAFLEVSPHPVLSFGAQETIEDALADPDDAVVLETLRREQGGPERFALALATAHAHGVALGWPAFFEATAAKAVPLPTYAFQRRRYWLNASSAAADASSIGQADPDHPLLGAVIEDPTGEGIILTGRISLSTHPWLADHTVAGSVLLPGTAFLEAALAAGQRAGTPEVEELTLQAPLLLPQRGAVQLQVNVSSPGQDATREVSIHSRAQAGQDEEPEPWTCHAQGILCAAERPAPEPLGQWPPQGAQPIEIEDLYERFAEAGFEYGPAFQGLRAAWREGAEVYAEVELGEEQRSGAQGFAVHPALLDSALHAIGLLEDGEQGALRLPFAWSGVALFGEGADRLRVKLSQGEEGVSVTIADEAGAAVGRVGALALREVDPTQLGLRRPVAQGLLAIEWKEAELGTGGEGPAQSFELVAEPGQDRARAAGLCTALVLEKVQGWLAEQSEGRLAILTRGAIATSAQESPDPVLASAWGLLRSAQSEHPGRFLLVDSDDSEASNEALTTVLCTEAGGEPQIALREGKTLVPRVTRLAPPPGDGEGPPTLDPERTILITGGTGALGGLVARRLVERHGARHLLLTSRRGPAAEDADDLRAVLEELGAEVEIAACDVAEPKSLKALLDSIPKEHPLGVVIHAAGLVDDATIAGLTSEHLGPVFAAKADAAWHLHELTAGIDLSAFVLFSSAAAAFGAPGQGNYAAANAFLDALAGQRRAAGLPATSIAWGLWQRQSAMTAHLGEVERARMARSGVEALSDEHGLELFDRALGSGHEAVLAVGLNRTALRALASAGTLPAILAGLVRTPRRVRSSTLSARLASAPPAEREALVLELVRAEVAAVLGHGSSQEVESAKAFKDLGFDSLAAVELRNRLAAAAGLRLGATVVFDYPNVKALTAHLLAEAGRPNETRPASEMLASEFDRLEALLAQIERRDQRDEAAARLRGLLFGVNSEQSAGLEDATDEEMFELLDRKLGQV